MQQYTDWVTTNVIGTGYGKCAEVTEQMAAAFPELRRVRGHYYCSAWGERSHWWLVTANGTIIDPTAAQFPSQGHGVYEPWPEGAEEPSGMCPNCGGLVYGGSTVCSDTCGISYAAYCLNP